MRMISIQKRMSTYLTNDKAILFETGIYHRYKTFNIEHIFYVSCTKNDYSSVEILLGLKIGYDIRCKGLLIARNLKYKFLESILAKDLNMLGLSRDLEKTILVERIKLLTLEKMKKENTLLKNVFLKGISKNLNIIS